jgi:MFS family permease
MRAGTAAPSARKFGALRYRDFTLLWAGLLVSNAGTWMQNVAQGWLTYQLTNSPFYLGLLGASFAVPMIALPMVGGTIADRIDRLAILKFTQTAMMLCAAAMATLSLLHVITIWDIIGISFLSSVALAVDNPTRQALIPDLVPPEELLSAISLNSVAFNGAALVGPALAGLILGLAGNELMLGSALVFYLNALSFLAVLGPVFLIRPRPVERPATANQFHAAIVEGFSYVKKRRALLLLLALSAVISVFGRSFSQLLPVFARDVLHVGSEGYGVMLALPGAGTLLAGFVLAGGGHHFDRRWLIVSSQLGFAASVIAFAVTHSFSLSLALLGISGFCATVFGAVAATILQVETEGHLRGRVMSLYTITIIGLGPMGSLISGSLATVISVSLAVILPALVIVVFLGFAISRPSWKDVR